jgi:small subunit ribosomal protein S6
MFLFDPASAIEWSNVEAEMKRLMDRAQAQIVVMRRWDERRLAYEINGRKRACYVLVYFRAAGDKINALERDVQLSEHVLRCLILRCDHLETDEEMTKAADDSVASISAPPPERPDRYRGRGDMSDGPGGDGGDDRPRFSDDRPRFSGDDRSRFSGGGNDGIGAVPDIEDR